MDMKRNYDTLGVDHAVSSEIAPQTKMAVGMPESTSIENMLVLAINKSVPVETMERLLAMRRELKQEAAKEAYDRAMAAFQAECPTIVKTKEVRTNSGGLAYKYAPIESIVSQVQPFLKTHGFSYSTTMELKETGVRVICKVTHEQGHSEESPMEVPFGTKTQMMSQSQVAAAASTFAKRYAFCNAFGILTGDEDTDAAPAQETSRMAPYTVTRTVPAADDEHQGSVIQEGQIMTNDEVIEVQKLKIKEQLTSMGHENSGRTEANLIIKQHTHLDLEPKNFSQIIERLEKELDGTNPLTSDEKLADLERGLKE